MTWIDDHRGSGPWDFEEQPDKWGYLNNQRWTRNQDAIDFSLESPAGGWSNRHNVADREDDHKPCGHWHKPASPISRPISVWEWKAAMQQPGQPYIYLYDIGIYSVIKIDTSLSPPAVVQVLLVNDNVFTLDYDNTGFSVPGAQRGGYCMSKDGSRLWYMFIDRNTDDAKIVEVDISASPAVVVQETIFTDLLPPAADNAAGPNPRITDGCTDDSYTYWATADIEGRIIKIDNSTHAIIDDHAFAYPISPTWPGGADGPIRSIDYSVNDNKLYWMYVRDALHEAPPFNARMHYIQANVDFTGIVDTSVTGTGVGTPSRANWCRVYGSDLVHNRNYHPNVGPLQFNYVGAIPQSHLINMLGVSGGYLYTLFHDNAVDVTVKVGKIPIGGVAVSNTITVTSFTGHTWLGTEPWLPSGTGITNELTGKTMLFHWHSGYAPGGVLPEYINYGLTIDEDLNILSEVAMNYIVIRSEGYATNEPMVWDTP